MQNGYRHLFIDADDTLWENNVYFETAFARFAEILNHSCLSPAEVRKALDDIEHVNRVLYGYGSAQFGRNMQQCYRDLAERACTPEDLDAVMDAALSIMRQPLVLIEGVKETLEYLKPRYQLTLFTKGDPDEQHAKVRASGLEPYFDAVVVAREKDKRAYEGLLEQRQATREESWMVGNSPKSDINPALAIGMNAAFVPHQRNWHLEEEDLVPGVGKLLHLTRFDELQWHL